MKDEVGVSYSLAESRCHDSQVPYARSQRALYIQPIHSRSGPTSFLHCPLPEYSERTNVLELYVVYEYMHVRDCFTDQISLDFIILYYLYYTMRGVDRASHVRHFEVPS